MHFVYHDGPNMKTNIYPVDRWFGFEDRWPPSVVEELSSELRISRDDTVYDPFAGCGTTAVVASGHGSATISCDVSPLATLITRYKLKPPKLSALASLADDIQSRRLTFRTLIEGSVKPGSGHDLDLCRFVFATAVLRTGWHLGAAWEDELVVGEAMRLFDEMAEDISLRENTSTNHQVACADFRSIEHIIQPQEGQIVMITSPPFYGSDVNPRVRRLESILDLAWPPECGSQGSMLCNSEPCSESNRMVGRNASDIAVYSYHSFLTQIAAHAVSINCSCIAIEMSGAIVSNEWVPFDEQLATLLARRGYRVHLDTPSAGRQQAERLVCGRR
jgi:hypothetical protein